MNECSTLLNEEIAILIDDYMKVIMQIFLRTDKLLNQKVLHFAKNDMETYIALKENSNFLLVLFSGTVPEFTEIILNTLQLEEDNIAKLLKLYNKHVFINNKFWLTVLEEEKLARHIIINSCMVYMNISLDNYYECYQCLNTLDTSFLKKIIYSISDIFVGDCLKKTEDMDNYLESLNNSIYDFTKNEKELIKKIMLSYVPSFSLKLH